MQFYSLNDSRNAPKDMKDVLLANGFHLTHDRNQVRWCSFCQLLQEINGYDGMKEDGMIGVVSSIDTETATTYRLVVHTAIDAPPVEAMPAHAEDNFANTYNVPWGHTARGRCPFFTSRA